ncbi:MAG: lactate utilization protein [Nanoarchaeota archaeon]|nr:lactate utilization protein [Nanoarchaeota archaeon]
MAQVAKALENFRQHRMQAFHAKSKEEVIEIIKGLIEPGQSVAWGGSKTLDELGVIGFIQENDYVFIDGFEKGITKEESAKRKHDAFNADWYLSGANAITETGEILNKDGRGNRVAAITYGPEKVMIIAGTNKLVKDLDEAERRIRESAAPLNTKRLGKDTPCVKTGRCEDCSSDDRICCFTQIIQQQIVKDRIHVMIVDGDYGF